MPWDKFWSKGDHVDSKVGIDLSNGDMTTLTRGVEHRGNKDDYPHMSFTVDIHGQVTNAHYSNSKHASDRVGTDSQEWRKPEYDSNHNTDYSGHETDYGASKGLGDKY